MASLSILGLYNFDDAIFEKIQLPAGMDREALINEILAECAELEIVYPDWDIMYQSIGFWSRTMLPSWTRAWNALQAEYNPLWNVDATIRELETRDLANSDDRSFSGSSKETGSDVSKSSGTETTTVSAYNSSDWANREKINSSGDRSDQTQASRTYKDGEERNGTETGTVLRETERHGNIGVTSSQQLVREEMEVAEMNLYRMIVDQFRSRYCLLIY